jgi:hemerythrin
MFDWRPEYSMNAPALDREHQSLFRIAAELHGAMVNGSGKEITRGILDRLVRYTLVHFAHEERLMAQAGYPGLEAHRAEHQALASQVQDFALRFEAGKIAVTVQLLQFLKGWLVDHIAGSDRRYVPYLRDLAA